MKVSVMACRGGAKKVDVTVVKASANATVHTDVSTVRLSARVRRQDKEPAVPEKARQALFYDDYTECDARCIDGQESSADAQCVSAEENDRLLLDEERSIAADDEEYPASGDDYEISEDSDDNGETEDLCDYEQDDSDFLSELFAGEFMDAEEPAANDEPTAENADPDGVMAPMISITRYLDRDGQGCKVEVNAEDADGREVICVDGDGRLSRICGYIKRGSSQSSDGAD